MWNSIKDNIPSQNGHKTRFWCCQDENQKSKSQPSQNSSAKPRDTIGMHCYSCKSKLNISVQANNCTRENTYTITIWLEHHNKHVPYYDVTLPSRAAAMIQENLEWTHPNKIAKKVLLDYPSVAAQQIYNAWTTMSETLWKRSPE